MSEEPTEKVQEAVHLPRELPNGWATATLAEVTEIVMGQSPSSKYYNTEGEGLPFFQGKAEFGDLYPAAVKWCSVPGKIAQKDDVLISVRAPVGPTNLAPSECCIGRGLAAIRPKHGIPSRYILHYLRSIERDVDSLGTGTTFKAISGKILREIPIPVAPLDQQARIVAEIEKQFSRLDEAVANLKRVKAHPDVEPASKLLDRILAERRAKWEETELAKMEARGKAPKNDKWKAKYKEPLGPEVSGLPSIPDTWAWATMPQLGELNRGKSKHRPRNDPILYGGNYPFVQTGDIRHATGVLTSWTQSYSEEGLKQSRLWPEGTLCITIAANIADTAILGFDACFPDSVVGFAAEHEQVETRFLEYFFRTAKENLERFAPATAQKNINLAILEQVAVALPPVQEQKQIIEEIERRLSIAESLDLVLDTSRERALRLGQSILTMAFSGQLAAYS